MPDSLRFAPAKFGPRPIGPNALERERLLALLERHAEAKLVLIHAPAGYGKSTLMAQWHRRLVASGRATAWICLDENDNDAGRLSAALSRVLLPQAGGETDLVGCVSECMRVHAEFTLFLDEEEHLMSSDAAALLETLLEFSPAAFHLVVGSRAQPRKLATRLQTRDDFLELTARDLAFRPEEVQRYVLSRCDISLDAPTVDALVQRTEGWAAALQLAAVQIAQGEHPRSVLTHLASARSNLLRYLSEVVLTRLRPRQRGFLLQTSFLDELSAPLCDAVTGHSDAEVLLTELQQANLLLQPIDPSGSRFRYHALFRELLRAQLQEQHPGQLSMLARRASDWCAREGRAESAAEYALLAADPALLIARIEPCMESLLTRGQFETVKRWLHALPPGELATRTNLLGWSAWASLWTNDFAAAEAAITALGRLGALQPEGTDQRLSHIILRVLLCVLQGRYDEALTALDSVGREWASAQRHVLVRLCNLRALLAQVAGQFGEAAAEAERAWTLAGQPGPLWLSLVHAAHIRGMTELSLGNLSGAWREMARPEQALRAAQPHAESGVNPSQLLALLCGSKALVLYERNQLGDAEDCLDRYRAFLNTVFSPSGRMLWHQLQARLHALRGDEERCLASLEEGSAYAIRHGIGWMEELMKWERVGYDLARGDLTHARSVAAGLLHSAGLDEAPRWIATCEEIFGPLIGALRFLIRSGQARRALDCLPAHIAHSERALRRLRLTKLHVLAAMAWRAEGNHARAIASLAQAVGLAGQTGAIRTFVDEGTACRELLGQLQLSRDPGDRAHLPRLLAAFDGVEDLEEQAAQPPSAALIPEPLSSRERQILQRLAHGHSNLAVGQQLSLSPNTIKWHLQQVYAKLGVRNRTQAVRAALQHKLVRLP
jgi:ATP/maltotriose-dependent transcriptional regulator MalT